VRVVAESSEAEMVAVFLAGELRSERFGPGIREAVASAGADLRVVASPNLTDAAENAFRLRILDERRAYLCREGIFGGFPDDVRWRWVSLTPEELMSVQFIHYSYWNELSGGRHLPLDAARRIREGVEPFGVSNAGFFELADELAGRPPARELILATAGESAPIVALEGHARLTALALRPEIIPRELEVLLGTSPSMPRWGCYQRLPHSPSGRR
jgi:hypothetical protein